MSEKPQETQEVIVIPESLRKPMDPNMPKIEIRRTVGLTINLQDFESARVDCSITVDGPLDSVDDIKDYINKQLDSQMKAAIHEIIELHDPDKTLMHYPRRKF